MLFNVNVELMLELMLTWNLTTEKGIQLVLCCTVFTLCLYCLSFMSRNRSDVWKNFKKVQSPSRGWYKKQLWKLKTVSSKMAQLKIVSCETIHYLTIKIIFLTEKCILKVGITPELQDWASHSYTISKHQLKFVIPFVCRIWLASWLARGSNHFNLEVQLLLISFHCWWNYCEHCKTISNQNKFQH